MWFLQIPESSNHALQAREHWLRPDVPVTIGRESSNTVVLVGAKSVSKLHARISVGRTAPDQVDERSDLIIEDLDTKFHTFLTYIDTSDEVILQKSSVTDKREVAFHLGKSRDVIFRIKWRSVVLTLSNIKAAEVRDSCTMLDIRYSKEWIESTTHVLTTKYNTPKALIGLAKQRWMIGKAYIQELDKRLRNEDHKSFSMPDATNPEFLPVDEFSTTYGHEVFFPNSSRQEAFSGLQFVFFSEKQFKSLSMPISAARGQSLLYEQKIEVTEISDYLHDLQRPVVVLPVDDENCTDLLDRLTPRVDCKSMTQADFIKVFLSDGKHEVYEAQKTKILQTETTSSPLGAVAIVRDTESKKSNDEVNTDAEATHEAPTEKGNESQTKTTISRIGSRGYQPLATFEDDLFGSVPEFAASQRSRPQLLTRKAQSRHSTARPVIEAIDIFDDEPTQGRTSRVQKRFSSPPAGGSTTKGSQSAVPPSPTGSVHAGRQSQTQQIGTSQKTTGRKRNTVREELEDLEFAPTAAALEKLRSQTREKSFPSQEILRAPDTVRDVTQSRLPPDVNIEEHIQDVLKANKRKAEIARLQSDAESSESNDRDMKNLGTVEFFEVPLQDSNSATSDFSLSGDTSNRSWAGRKNFKGFRRATRGTAAQPRGDRPAIMIRLVESRPSDRALADKTWLESATTRHRNTPRVGQGSTTLKRLHGANEESNAYDSHTQTSTQTVINESQNQEYSNSRKSTSLRSRQTLFMPDDSDSDEDPLKFRL